MQYFTLKLHFIMHFQHTQMQPMIRPQYTETLN